MEKETKQPADAVRPPTGNKGRLNTDKLQRKWGVSKQELDEAVRHVGENRSRIEEFLVNKKWQNTNGSS